MRIPRQLVRGLDPIILVCVLLLVTIGLATVLSSALKSGLGEVKPYFMRQLVWASLGLLVMVVTSFIDYRVFALYSPHFYCGIVLILLTVLLTGHEVHGSQRWFRFLGFQSQPSEIVKVACLFALAGYFDRVRERIREMRVLLGALIIAAVPAFLIVIQPDLGTGLVIVAMLGGMLVAANARRRHLAVLAGAGIVVSPIMWGFLKDYQKARLLSFINPNLDPLGASYQVIQSKIAIGSGGFGGTGWLAGTQSQLNYLPEQHTDFIFSVFAEQWGFIGSCILAMLYLGLLLQALKISESARDFLGSMLAVGIVSIIAFQSLVNLLMTVGLMPVTGIPLPFMSYGGSNLLTMLACVGLLLSVNRRSHIF
jgi:rod shape determining protein RodA